MVGLFLLWDRYEQRELARGRCTLFFVSGEFADGMELLAFSHFAVGGCRGTLGLFELFSFSCTLSSRSSLLALMMLSPSPSSESKKSKDA